MIWAFYRAAAGMIDSPSVCIIEGQSSHSHNNHCVNICVCVCVHLFCHVSLRVGVKAVSCRHCYAKICCLHSSITLKKKKTVRAPARSPRAIKSWDKQIFRSVKIFRKHSSNFIVIMVSDLRCANTGSHTGAK